MTKGGHVQFEVMAAGTSFTGCRRTVNVLTQLELLFSTYASIVLRSESSNMYN